MITNLYQIYDNTAEQIAGPIVAFNRDAAAIRMFHEVLQDKTTQPGKYPDQFDLIQIGTQDTETGEITSSTPDLRASGADWEKAQRLLQQRQLDTQLEHSQP